MSLSTEVLKCNSRWVAIEAVTARKAFEDISAGAAKFLKFEEGYPIPLTLEEWVELEVPPGADYITTSRMHGLKKILIPRVMICVNYGEFRAKEQPCTPDNLLKRYGHRDAVTGKKLKRENFSREHVVPRSRGGGGNWDNIVPMDRNLNSRRGNREYSDLGLREPTILSAPKPLLPINSLVNKHRWPEWKQFGVPDPIDNS